jgi:hypothetical protein
LNSTGDTTDTLYIYPHKVGRNSFEKYYKEKSLNEKNMKVEKKYEVSLNATESEIKQKSQAEKRELEFKYNVKAEIPPNFDRKANE